ncbi:MAG: hypothetical protein NG747_07355 [Candidatus Brocadia sp.]|nr:hypothetical protein [Candidatus Brocadia sp.]NUO08443.1 hypothetical protein [Candidatus Brocadia sp.]
MEKFLERYHNKITGVLSTFDQMIFKGNLVLCMYGLRRGFLFKYKSMSMAANGLLNQSGTDMADIPDLIRVIGGQRVHVAVTLLEVYFD